MISLATIVGLDPNLPTLITILTQMMELLTIAAFAAVWFYIFLRVWRSKEPSPPVFNDAIQYLAPILTALVGGIVAMAFGISLSQPPHSLLVTSADLLSFKPSVLIFGIYIVTYLLLGAGSGVLWVARTDATPPLVKNFAMTTVGLVVAVVGASFGIKS